MKTIISLKKAVGKNLTAVSADGRALFLIFGDEFAWMEAESGYDNEPLFEEQKEFPWVGRHYTSMLEAGVATKDELQALLAAAEAKRILASERMDRESYERLKLKYEGVLSEISQPVEEKS